MSSSFTPMIEQYRQIKNQYPEEILFFRLGDFYEMFFTDAEKASRELEITLTSRDAGGGNRVPMCGVPYHAAEGYIAKLIRKGYKVAICEQVEDPREAKGIVRREVIRVITPGTILTEGFLPQKDNNFLVAVYESATNIAMAAADLSTGECFAACFSGGEAMAALCDELYRLMPAEMLLVGGVTGNEKLHSFLATRLACSVSTVAPPVTREEVQSLLAEHFGTGIPDDENLLIVVGCLLRYLHETQKTALTHINKLEIRDAAQHLVLDATALRHLEVIRNNRDGGHSGTLLSVLDFTQTAMGGRTIRRWLEYPLGQPVAINRRLDGVEELLQRTAARRTISRLLSQIYDLERILTKVDMGSANARDLVALKNSLAILPSLKEQLTSFTASILHDAGWQLSTHNDIVDLIVAAIADNPPFSVREGQIIRDGYNLELDQLRSIARNSQAWIEQLEETEREKTGIKSLKVGYNKVFGYYIEVTNANLSAVPPTYVRKQTLVNAERFTTPELKEFEKKVLGAQAQIVNLEYHLFCRVRDYVRERLKEVQETARIIAEIDVLVSFAEAAARYNYVRPRINTSGEIVIKDGRHPVVERLIQNQVFVPNDVCLNHRDQEILLITGPNMAGKSTFMRQVALLVLMAHVGSFVPAREADIAIVDRIFTRVGASDDLAMGQSTFMLEMVEVADILRQATRHSLILLDEVGRGTSTFDGISIARAVIEYIATHIHAKTLFATHYHELTSLEDFSNGIKNYSVAIKERGDDVVFLRRVVPGAIDRSYGIQVAKLAGLPPAVIKRARALLAELEQKTVLPPVAAKKEVAATANAVESISLFQHSLADELLALDIMSMTPIEALNILFQLQQKAKREGGTG